MKKGDVQNGDELRPEYRRSDFGDMVRGKYAQRPAESSNVVMQDPDAAKVLLNQRAVNQALGWQEGPMNLTFKCEQEEDGRWLAEVPQLPGVMAYGATAVAAMASAQVLALRVIAERIEHDQGPPLNISMSIPSVA